MEIKPYRTMRLKIVAMTLCFSLIPLFALGFTVYYQFSLAYQKKVMDNLKTLVKNRRSAVELFFGERIAQLTTVAKTHTLERLKDEQYLNNLFKILQQRSKSFIDLGVIDDDGQHIAYVGPHYDKLIWVNYAHEEWFQAVMTSGVYVSDVFLGFRRIPHFIIAVTGIEGNRSWVLRATIDSEILENMVRAAQVGKRGDAFIINKKNILQTSPRFSGEILGTPTTPDFSKTVQTRVEELTYGGETGFFGATEIAYPKWVLVAREDPAEEMAALFGARYTGQLIMAAGVLLLVIGTIFTSRSITNELIRFEREKAKADDMLMQSSKMAALGKMAAGVAHEINNPLQIIGDQAGWMKDLIGEEDLTKSQHLREFEECIRKIERHVERCRAITHRLLRFGRRMETTQEQVDVNQVLAETITFLENEAHYRDIHILTFYDEMLPKITTDQNQLQQVFLNIIDNAIDAIGKAGTMSIKTYFQSDPRKQVVVDISDTGPGIPQEIRGRIFDPFFTTKKANEGTGLGLSITYSIVEKLGGQISVKSGSGRGTTFTIALPVV
jgi:two-component system NtrC family sensor kinase